MKLKANCGRLEVKGLGITLTQSSTEDEIKRALKHSPNLAQFIEGAPSTKKTLGDGKQ